MEIWEVSQVNRRVKDLLDDDPVLRDLWVEGEISNFSVSMNGHAYFTLKDATSQLRCVMFRGQLARARKRPENGERCVARGPLRVYEPQGAYQLYTEFIAPAGLGELQLRLEALKARLEAEGLFEPSRKRPLPLWPTRIGVVTSSTGAVIHDIQTVIARRWPLAEIILAPAPVQGDDAPPKICRAIEDLNQRGRVDVIIVARGGGSLEDLWPFNDESVARAIFASRVPTVSAIGHEVDVTVADLVADYRAPTPSAAAEVVVPNLADVRARLADSEEALSAAASHLVEQNDMALRRLELRLLQESPTSAIRSRQTNLTALLDRIKRAVQHDLAVRGERVTARAMQMSALNPIAILDRGFSVSWRRDDGHVVKRTVDVTAGDRLRSRVKDGTYDSVVTETEGVVADSPTERWERG